MAKDYFYISHYGRKGMKWGKNIFGEDPSAANSFYRRLGAQQATRQNQNPQDAWRREASSQQSAAQQSPRAQEAWRQAASAQAARNSVTARSIWANRGATQEKALQAWLQRNRVNRESDPNVKAMRDAVNRQRLERAAESTRGTQLAATNRWLEKTGGPTISPKSNAIGPDAAAMAKRAEAQARQASAQVAKDSAAANAPIDRANRGTSIRDKAESMEEEKRMQENLQKAYGGAIAASNKNAAMSKASSPLSASTKNAGVEQMEREKAAFEELSEPKLKKIMKRAGVDRNTALRLQFEKDTGKLSEITEEQLSELKKKVQSDPEFRKVYDAAQYYTKMMTGMSYEDYVRKNRKASKKTLITRLMEG